MKKIHLIISLLLLFLFTIGNICLQAQPIPYLNTNGHVIATSDSRLVATIKEFEEEVHIECILVGYLYLGSACLSLEYDPAVVVPINGPGGDEIVDNRTGGAGSTSNQFQSYFKLSPTLPGPPSSWDVTGAICPQPAMIYTGKANITNIRCAQLQESFKLTLPAGDIISMFTVYFKKKPGQTLTNTTFKYYDRSLATQVYNEFSHFAIVRHIGTAAGVNINTKVFSRRIPSTVETIDATVNVTSVTFDGFANSEGLTKIPSVAGVSGGLDWDTLVTTGFIYSKNDVALTIDEYTRKIKINGVAPGYDFPTPVNGSFTLGDYTFYMVFSPNTDRNTQIEMEETVTDLAAGTYYAYAFMQYKFQTSNPYPVIGEQIEFEIEACKEPLVMATNDGGLCNSANIMLYISNIADYTNPTYQWYEVNEIADIPVGTNSSSYLPVETGEYYVVVSDEINNIQCSVVSATKEVIIVPGEEFEYPQPIIVANNEGEFCGTVVVKLTVINADVYPEGTTTYQWYHNDVPMVGVTGNFHTVTAIGIYRVEVIVNDCSMVSGTKLVTGDETLIPLPPTVQSPYETCSGGNPLTLADIPVDGVNIIWYNAGNDVLPITTQLIDGATYWVSQYVDDCESDLSSVLVIFKDEMVIPAPEIDSPMNLCSSLIGKITLGELPVNDPKIVWYRDPAGTVLAPSNTILIDNETFYAALVIGNCESTKLTKVEVVFTPSIHTVPEIKSPQYFCEGATFNDVNAPNYVVWYASPTATTPLLKNTILTSGTYYAAISIGATCESTERVPVVIGINPLDPDYAVEEQYFCTAGATVAHLSITGYGTIWYSEPELENLLAPGVALEHGVTYYGANTSGECIILSVAVTAYIHETILPPTVPTTYELCGVEGNVTLAMIPVKGKNLQWYDSDMNPIPATTPVVNGTIYWVSQSLGSCESEMSYVKVTINENMEVPAPDINSPVELCNSLINVIKLGDLPVNGLHVQWYYDAAGTLPASPNFPIPASGFYYAALVIGECQSTELTKVEVKFLPFIETVPVISSPQYFCEGVTFSNVNAPENVVWYANIGDTEPLPFYTILESKSYFAAISFGSDCESAERLEVEIVINPVDYDYPFVDQYFCSQATVADLSMTGYNVVWYLDAELKDAVGLNELLINGTTYYGANTNGDCAIINLAVTANVYEMVLPPTVEPPYELCGVEGSVTLAMIPVQGKNLQWYDNDMNPLPENTPVISGAIYWVSQTLGACESNLSYVKVTINPNMIVPAPEINSPIQLCNSLKNVIKLNELPIGGLKVNWYDATGVVPVSENTVLNGNSTFYAAWVVGECESTELTKVDVEFLPGIETVPVISSPQYFCNGAVLRNVNAPDYVIWYENEFATEVLPMSTLLTSGTYYAAIRIGDCESTARVPVVIGINPVNPAYETENQYFCFASTVADLAVAGYGITWYSEPTLENVLDLNEELVHGKIYYAANTNGTCAIINLAVKAFIHEPLLPPTVPTVVERCSVGNFTLNDIQVQGINLQWYDNDMNPIPATTIVEDGAIYWVSQRIGTCVSDLSYVKITINPNMIIPAPEITSPMSLCSSFINNITLGELPVNGLELAWYLDPAGTVPLPSYFKLQGKTTLYAAWVIGECEGSKLTKVEIVFTPVINTVPNIASPQYFCGGAMLSDINAPNNVLWYADEFSTKALPMNTLLENGTYYAATTIGSCQSTQRAEVAIVINPVDYNYPSEDQYFCSAGVKVADLFMKGYGVTWYSDPELLHPLDLNEDLIHGNEYYGANTSGTCAIIGLKVTAYIHTTILPPTAPTLYELCGVEGNVTLAMIPVEGKNLQWYDNDMNQISETTPIVNGEIYWVSQRFGTCESELSYVRVIINPEMEIPAPEIASPIELCNNLKGITLNQLPINGLNVVWYYDNAGNYPASPATQITGKMTFYAALVVGECQSTELTQVVVEFLPEITSVPQITTPQYFCEGATFNEVNAPKNIAWYANMGDVKPLPMNTVLETSTYYAAVSFGSGCESTVRVPVEIYINTTNPILNTGERSFCFGAILADIGVTGYGVQWFDNEALAGEALPLNMQFEPGTTTYYAANTNGGCRIMNIAITVDVAGEVLPPVLAEGAETNVCEGTAITAAYLVGLIEPVNNIDFVIYTDAACTTLFEGVIVADYSDAPYTFYARAYYEGTNCSIDVEDALQIEITVTQIPNAPEIAENANTSVCDGALIDETLLYSLIVYDDAIETVEYYMDAGCIIPFEDITADYNDGSYTIYVIARSLANINCATSVENALELTITVNPLPTIPEIKQEADLSICNGATIDVAFLQNLIDYDVTEVNLVFFMDAACTVPFTNITTDASVNESHTVYAIAVYKATGCAINVEDALEITIEVTPTPYVDFVRELVYCSTGEEVEAFYFPGSDHFYWEYVVGSYLGLDEINGEDSIPAFTPVNFGEGPISALYKVTAQNGECKGNTWYFYITVNPKPITTAVEDMVYCNGETAPQYCFNSIFASYHHLEFVYGTDVVNAGNGIDLTCIPSFLATNTTNEEIVCKYRVKAVYAHTNVACYDTEWKEFYIIILPTPSAALNIGPFEYYVNETTEVIDLPVEFASLNNPSGTNYKWNYVTGGFVGLYPTSGTNTIPSFATVSQPASALYEVEATINNCKSDTKTQFWIVIKKAPANIDPIPNFVYCNGEDVPAYPLAGNNIYANYCWEQIDGDDIGLPPSGCDYFPAFMAVNDTQEKKIAYFKAWASFEDYNEVGVTFSVTILPSVMLNISSKAAACVLSETVNIEYEEINIENVQYSLVFGFDALVAGFVNQSGILPATFIEVPVPQGIKVGNYAATLTVTLGECKNTYPIIIAISAEPKLVSKSDETTYICATGEVAHLFAVVEGNALQYEWYFKGDLIASATQPSYDVIFDSSTEGKYTLKVTNSCGYIDIVFYVYESHFLIKQKWDDVIYVDNIGNKYVRYQWYKNGVPLAQYGTYQYYSAESEGGKFPYLAEYYVKAYKADDTYDEYCPIIPNMEIKGGDPKFFVYPNPATQGQKVTFLFQLPVSEKPDAVIQLFDVAGKLINTYQISDYQTDVIVNIAAGTYIVRANLKSGREFVNKVIIQK